MNNTNKTAHVSSPVAAEGFGYTTRSGQHGVLWTVWDRIADVDIATGHASDIDAAYTAMRAHAVVISNGALS